MDIIGFTSYLLGTISFTFLTVLLLIGGHAKNQGIWLITAAISTMLWFALLALDARFGLVSNAVTGSAEILAMIVWLLFLQKLLLASLPEPSPLRRPIRALRAAVLLLGGMLFFFAWCGEWGDCASQGSIWANTPFFGELVLSVIGLVQIEQYYKNTRADKRPLVKYLCFALGGIFAYQFYLYSDAMLFGLINQNLWNARGAVISVLVPLIVVAAKRNSEWAPDIFVSRGVVFHSATFLVAGIYLLLMAAVGKYIRVYGGEWGAVLQILFLVSAFIVLLILLFSGQIRARFRVFLSKNFFTYAFDYRDEWLKIIALFSDQSDQSPVEEKAIMALAGLVDSPAGALWIRQENHLFRWTSSYRAMELEHQDIAPDEPVIRFIQEQGWIISLEEMERIPELYEGLQLPDWMERSEALWLIVPLYHAEALFGLIFLARPRSPLKWNWEVRDLLKTTGSQAAGYLALEQAARQLAEARQFEGFNRLSAFVIHDLKNLIAQLSLVVRNAEKHAGNPRFMADAIKTVDHSVDKMQRLMSQLKNTSAEARNENLQLVDIIREVTELRSRQLPVPLLELDTGVFPVISATRDRLVSSLEHIIQNAQDAAGKHGAVQVVLRVDPEGNLLVEVVDNGCGMDEEFIRQRLFKPFETTKGLTGMGIGAYESREYIRSVGGDLQVESTPGSGTVFRFMLPAGIWEQGPVNRQDGTQY